MSEYFAKINWVRDSSESYVDNKYSRGHEWVFDVERFLKTFIKSKDSVSEKNMEKADPDCSSFKSMNKLW